MSNSGNVLTNNCNHFQLKESAVSKLHSRRLRNLSPLRTLTLAHHLLEDFYRLASKVSTQVYNLHIKQFELIVSYSMCHWHQYRHSCARYITKCPTLGGKPKGNLLNFLKCRLKEWDVKGNTFLGAIGMGRAVPTSPSRCITFLNSPFPSWSFFS